MTQRLVMVAACLAALLATSLAGVPRIPARHEPAAKRTRELGEVVGCKP